MDRFVCVRLVQANALDLSLFQFDYDLTFAVFFMNAERVVYGRFGSRSEREDATKDITIEGFRKAMAAALELHRGYPGNRASLAGKLNPKPRFATPDDYPALHGKYKPVLDEEGAVVRSCMHCHQVREAERLLYRSDHKPIPDEVLYPWPIPDIVGLSLDPADMAKIEGVTADSPAARAGFEPGDKIVAFEGQPMISIADVQWVLHNASQPAVLQAQVLRGATRLNLALRLGEDWRRKSDIAWRATTWDLRRMATGGMVLKNASAETRRAAGLSGQDLALLVEHVGEYGEHAVAKKAGLKKGDLVLSVDGQDQAMTESQLIGYLLQHRMPGARVTVTVLRGKERLNFELRVQ